MLSLGVAIKVRVVWIRGPVGLGNPSQHPRWISSKVAPDGSRGIIYMDDPKDHSLVFQMRSKAWCLDGMFLGSSDTSSRLVFGSLGYRG